MRHWQLVYLLTTFVYAVFGQTQLPQITQTTQAPPTPANNQVCLIVPPDVEECYRHFQGKPIDDKAAQVNCLQKLLWNFTPDENNTVAELDYFKSLAGGIAAYSPAAILRDGAPRPPTGRRERQEYRTLNQRERHRFHDALNRLYEDGTIRAFARLHARAYKIHGNGSSFLPWFRVFLAMFEEALRRIDPSVSLPFWDSTIDNDMDNPVNSAIWSVDYFGPGVGDVISGPAAGWVTDQGNLERNYGQASRLFAKDQIRKVLSKCELKDISQPTADIEFDFEWYQGGVHVWVGGDMRSPATAGYDPIFYMHHAFVDYIWELFRRRQFERCNVDPVTNYPTTASGGHAPDAPMTGFEWLTNIDGLKGYWLENWYSYQSTPSCPNCCRGCPFPAPIYCNTRRRRICVARSRRKFAFDTTSQKAAFSQASLDPAEIDAISNPPPPRNRGVAYRHSPSDGRSIHTAISDAFSSLSQEEPAGPVATPRRRDRTDRRTLGGQQIDMTRRGGSTLAAQRSVSERDSRRAGGASDGILEPISPGRRVRPTPQFIDQTVPPPTRGGRFDPPRTDRRAPADTRGFPESRGGIPLSNRLSIPDNRRPLPERRSFLTSDRRRGVASNTLEPRASDRRFFADRGPAFSDRDRMSGRRLPLPERRSMTSRRSDVIPF